MNFLYMAISGILYRLGGWKSFKWCKHNKIIRRFGIPILILFILSHKGYDSEDCWLTAVLASLALHHPLGVDEPWHVNVSAGLCMSLYSVCSLGLSWLNMVPFIVYFLSLWASTKWPVVCNWWKCEVALGVAFIIQVL